MRNQISGGREDQHDDRRDAAPPANGGGGRARHVTRPRHSRRRRSPRSRTRRAPLTRLRPGRELVDAVLVAHGRRRDSRHRGLGQLVEPARGLVAVELSRRAAPSARRGGSPSDSSARLRSSIGSMRSRPPRVPPGRSARLRSRSRRAASRSSAVRPPPAHAGPPEDTLRAISQLSSRCAAARESSLARPPDPLRQPRRQALVVELDRHRQPRARAARRTPASRAVWSESPPASESGSPTITRSAPSSSTSARSARDRDASAATRPDRSGSRGRRWGR